MEKVTKRLEELKNEYEKGQKALIELQAREVALKESLLRISGVIQVLEELSKTDETIEQEIDELTNVAR